MGKQQDHVEVLRQIRADALDRYEYARNKGTSDEAQAFAEYEALAAAIAVLTVDEAMEERATNAFNAAPWGEGIRAALRAAIHGEAEAK